MRVRRIHGRDLHRAWEFLKLCFRDVNRGTVEQQRPRSKRRFLEVYEEEGVVQLLFFEIEGADDEAAEEVPAQEGVRRRRRDEGEEQERPAEGERRGVRESRGLS